MTIVLKWLLLVVVAAMLFLVWSLTEGTDGKAPADNFAISEHHLLSTEFPEGRQVHFLYFLLIINTLINQMQTGFWGFGVLGFWRNNIDVNINRCHLNK